MTTREDLVSDRQRAAWDALMEGRGHAEVAAISGLTVRSVATYASQWKIKCRARKLPPWWRMAGNNPQEVRAVRAYVRREMGLELGEEMEIQLERVERQLQEMADDYGYDKVVIRWNPRAEGLLEFVRAREGVDEHMWWERDPAAPWRPWEEKV